MGEEFRKKSEVCPKLLNLMASKERNWIDEEDPSVLSLGYFPKASKPTKRGFLDTVAANTEDVTTSMTVQIKVKLESKHNGVLKVNMSTSTLVAEYPMHNDRSLVVVERSKRKRRLRKVGSRDLSISAKTVKDQEMATVEAGTPAVAQEAVQVEPEGDQAQDEKETALAMLSLSVHRQGKEPTLEEVPPT
ncbi:uncharacterized protein A4U43_C01F20790 [Asparagus officinalis]|uniref:Uncharacterized protein n=1 Tax=Asparagus officinalis TaxID=4686 RepID=A0A5P1FVD7_ASPOF|nr:uncharacterized protein A4U43_C01F20790 [Asparagus officinalis]